MTHRQELPVIIAGAGIVGLALAQALKTSGIPFRIYERDEHLHARFSGWGLSIDLTVIEDFLPKGLFQDLSSIQADPRQRPTDVGSAFLNLETAKPSLTIPSSFRRRVNRGRLRKLLATNLDINWGKAVVGFRSTRHGVSVSFSDGTDIEGSVLVAADGSGSKTRRLLVGNDLGRRNPLPAQCLTVTARVSEDKVGRLFHPRLFQGSHPGTGYYMFFAVLSTPRVNGSAETETPFYEAQLDLSWLSRDAADAVPLSNADRLSRIKRMAMTGTGFHSTLREIIEDIPDDAPVRSITLADWPTIPWNGFGGRVTLIGDAAHPMTMYRGEAANQGFKDVRMLTEQLRLWYSGNKSRQDALAEYEAEMTHRGHEAVLLSRQACMDAHDLCTITADSPLICRSRVR